jgi:hypothetical protein
VVRRAIAAGAAVIVLLVLVFGVRACLSARKAQAFEDYVTEVGALVEESDQQGRSLFELLEDPGGQSSVDVENTVNGFRVAAEQLVERARATERPDELERAQVYLIEALDFRSDGLRGIASELPAALGEEGHRDAALAIAGQMLNFVASDVIYSQRVIPAIQEAARQEDLLERVGSLPESQFLPNFDWLDPKTVTGTLAGIRGGGTPSDEPATPGLHGTGLGEVTVQPSGQVLAESGVTAIAEAGDLAFDVQVQNQGENDEDNVAIRISIAGADETLELSGEIDSIGAGETVTATIPLAETPPSNEELDVEVEVEGVPGEERLENNNASYLVRFGGA